ncbi:MAG: ribonuclease HII [Ascidiaceihabitans sp.]|jgi:ribonuclease HII|nr:ribonuclease HII [Ascidiaceihabitans sp.]
MPDFAFETELGCRVAGVDEVGRGPLAGPVTAAAVVLDPKCIPDGLNDSKKLTAKRRLELYRQLLDCADVSIAHASVAEIDEVNILRASHLAMERAIAGLQFLPEHVLIDGNMIPRGLHLPATTLVKGDSRSISISAASIVAKVCRDCVLVDLAQQHPGYGWETNMGYGSKKHMEALQKLGVTPHHRRSFKPVHNMLYQEKIVTNWFNKEIDLESPLTQIGDNRRAQ